MIKEKDCKSCGHIHTFEDHCGQVLSADEELGIVYDDCGCGESQ